MGCFFAADGEATGPLVVLSQPPIGSKEKERDLREWVRSERERGVKRERRVWK